MVAASDNRIRPTEADQERIAAFVTALWLEEGLAGHSRQAYASDLRGLAGWLSARDLHLGTMGREALLAYLAERVQGGARPRSVSRLLSSLRRYCRWQVREGLRADDPSVDIDAPRIGRSLPGVLSETAVDRLLAAPDTGTPVGERDRALLELLYGSGLRVSELVTLTLTMVDTDRGVLVIGGKGSKQRLVPMGEPCVQWLEQHLHAGRKALLRGRQSEDLFVTARGRGMTRQAVWYRIKHYAVSAGLSADLSPHSLRHCFATHLLDHGADLRVLQLLLGHETLSATQIYTHVARQRLQRLHREHHPRG